MGGALQMLTAAVASEGGDALGELGLAVGGLVLVLQGLRLVLDLLPK